MEHNLSSTPKTLDTNQSAQSTQSALNMEPNLSNIPPTLIPLNNESSRQPDSNELKTIYDFLKKQIKCDTSDSFIQSINELEKAFQGYRKQGLFVPIQLKSDIYERKDVVLFISYKKNYLTVTTRYSDFNIFYTKTNFIHSVTRTDLKFLEMFSIFNSIDTDYVDTLFYKDNFKNCLVTSFPNLMYLDAIHERCNPSFENSYINSSLLTNLNFNTSCKCLNLSKILEYCPNLKNISITKICESNIIEILSTLSKDGRVFERVKIQSDFVKPFQVPSIVDNSRLRIKTLVISNVFAPLIIQDKKALQRIGEWKHFFKIDRLLMTMEDDYKDFHPDPLSIFYCSDDELIQLVEVFKALECIIVGGLMFYRVASDGSDNPVKNYYTEHLNYENSQYHGQGYRPRCFTSFLDYKSKIKKQHLDTLDKECLVKYLGWLYTHRNFFDSDFQQEIEDKYNIFTFCNGSVIPKNNSSNHNVNSIYGFFNSGLFDRNLLGIITGFIPKTKDIDVNKRGIKRRGDEVEWDEED